MMSNENPTPNTAEVQPDLTKSRNEVNTLLHQLEGMVDPAQHQFLTDFLMEWSVLSAMRTTLALQTKTAGATTTTESNSESGKSEESGSGSESGKGQ